MIGIPNLLANGNFQVHQQLVVENNEGVDLADVSVVKDLKTQLGPDVFVSVSGLTLVTPPTSADSSIALNVLGWDGTSATNLIDQSVATNLLASGDSFEIGFKVEIDAMATKGVLEKKTTVAGTAINSARGFLTDAVGNKITALDDSNSEADPRNTDSSVLSDIGGINEPAIRSVPSLSLVKTSGDAFANGDNWDVTFTLALENNGTLAINKVEIFDDLAAVFGGQFSGVTLDRVTAGSKNTGSALIANPRFTEDTSTSLVTSTGPVNIGDTFEVVFTVTIDPNVDGNAVSGLDSQASAVCQAVDEAGDTVTNLDRSSATAQQGSNKGVGRAVASEPAPKVIADIAVAKSVARGPLPLANGNFGVTYELIIANAGNVDLAELTLVEDLADQFGSVLLRAGKVALASPPSHARSRVKLDGSWNGDGATELVKQTISPRLAFGDSFTVEFSVEVDPSAAGGPSTLENQAVVSGKPVEVIPEELLASSDDVILATEVADAGADLNSENLTAEVDQESSDDTAPPSVADLTIKKAIAGDPVQTDRGNYVVTYQLLIENTGNVGLANLSLQEDLLTLFGPPLIKAGNLTITSGPSDPGSSVSVDSVGWNGKTGTELLDSLAPNVLASGDALTIQFEVELNPKRLVSPQESQAYPSLLPGFHSAKLTPIGDLITSFIGAPGPIYSGLPVDQNPSPFELDSESRVPSRYSVGDGSIMAAV